MVYFLIFLLFLCLVFVVISFCVYNTRNSKEKPQEHTNIKTIAGYITRDADGTLKLWTKKPMRGQLMWTIPPYDHNSGGLTLNKKMFKYISWNCEPLDVTINISHN